MKKCKLFLVSVYCLILINEMSAQIIEVSDEIATNTTWYADTVLLIGDLCVKEGVKLTISPGTLVIAEGNYKITINGSIEALGNLEDTITFTVNDHNNFWEDTTSNAGGWKGFWISSDYNSTDTSIFNFCKFQYGKKYGNIGEDVQGGVMHVENYGNLIIKNSLFFANMVICNGMGVGGAEGGALYCSNVNNILIEKDCFIRNRSFEGGGAMHIDKNCHSLIRENYFSNNWAISWDFSLPGWVIIAGFGAAISTSDAENLSPAILNNICTNNVTILGIICLSNLNCIICNNLICNNNGCGIFDGHQLSISHIFNNTVVNNKTRDGGIKVDSKAIIYNNICWGNLLDKNEISDQIVRQGYNQYSFYNCIQYGNGGSNSINSLPLFQNTSSGIGVMYNGMDANWTLKNQSPCINTGTPDTSGLLIPLKDLANNKRIFGIIDMGCYENQEVLSIKQTQFDASKFLDLYPNPALDFVTFYADIDEESLAFTEESGKIVFIQKVEIGKNFLSIRNLKSGIYIVVTYDKWKNIERTGKLIIR